jgi:hypothetical protein
MKRIIVLLVISIPLLSFSLLSLRAADETPQSGEPPPSATWLIRNSDFVDTASVGIFADPERLAELAVESIEQKDRTKIIRMLDKKDIELSFNLQDRSDGPALLTATVIPKTPKGQENLRAASGLIFDAVEKALRAAYESKYEEILKRLQADKDSARQSLDEVRSAVIQKKSQLAQDYNIMEPPHVVDEILVELQKEETALQLKAVAVETETNLLREKYVGELPPGVMPAPAFDKTKASPDEIKKRLEEINAETEKTQNDMKQYKEQIAEMEKQIEDMAAESGEDDPAVQELRNSLKIVQDALKKSGDKLQQLTREKQELENPDAAPVPPPEADPNFGNNRAEAMKRLEELHLRQEIIRNQQEFIRKEIEKRSERVKAIVALLAEIENLKNKQYYLEQEYKRAAERYNTVSFECNLKKETIIRRTR